MHRRCSSPATGDNFFYPQPLTNVNALVRFADAMSTKQRRLASAALALALTFAFISVSPARASLFFGADTELKLAFRNIASEAGLNATTIYGGEKTNRFLLETTGCGVALFDFDGDGWLDIYQVNGSRLEGNLNPTPRNHLYHNNRDGSFSDVTDASGTGHTGWGQGVCVGDYDGDGRPDLFVTYWGRNVLYRNLGNGTFSDVSVKAGVAGASGRWNTGCAFLDYDRDGDLDLFIANYIDFDPRTAPTPDSGLCLYKGIRVACGPPGLNGGKNLLYRNNGDGTFTDVSQAAGILNAHGTYGLGVLVSDFDGDGWPDVYVANDSNPSALYHNNHDGTFTDIGIVAGCAYSQDGKPQAGMGVSAGDFDHDGWIDIFKTNFAGDTSNLYRNVGKGDFEEFAFGSGIGLNTRFLGWGCGFVDLDNDGWLDIFQVNGHVYPEVATLKTEAQYRQRKIVYKNVAGKRFVDVTESIGGPLLDLRAGRGCAFGDIDNDGDVDVVVNNINAPMDLYRLDLPGGRHWLTLALAAKGKNSSAIGARVHLVAQGVNQTDEVRSGGSYFSQSDLRLHFGLGSAEKVDRLEIRWPDGTSETFSDIRADRIIRIAQENGKR